MARIQTYNVDSTIDEFDKLVGTDGTVGADLNKTKNFTLGDIRAFANLGNTLDSVLNNGNSVALSTTSTKGINIDMSATPATYQNGIKITMPQITGGMAPNSDAFVSFLNGQDPATLTNFVSSFYSVVGGGSDSVSFVSEHAAGVTNSEHAHYYNGLGVTSDFIKGIKAISSDPYVDSAVFRVDSDGNTTSKSFIKEDGSGNEFLMADGGISTMPTLQQITGSGGTTTDTIFVNKETGSGSTGIVINTINNLGMAITSEAEVCLQLNPSESTGLMITSGDATGIQIALDAGLGIGISTAAGTGINVTANEGSAIYAGSDSGTGIVVSSYNGDGVNITSNQTGLYVNSLNGIVVGNGGVIISGNVSDDQGYQLYLTSNSAAKPSTNTWTIASDERVKTNINPYTKGLETILAINPVTYDYNGKAGFDPTSTGNIGVIAQDVLNIIPESINTYQAKLNEEDEEKTELYNFDSHALTFILINAIKQLSAEIELLKST